MVAWLRTADGRDIGLTLDPDGDRLVATVPSVPSGASTGGRLFAFTLAVSAVTGQGLERLVGAVAHALTDVSADGAVHREEQKVEDVP